MNIQTIKTEINKTMTRFIFAAALVLATLTFASSPRTVEARVAPRVGETHFNLVSLSNEYALKCHEAVPVPADKPCCPPPCISYREHGCRKICCGCEPPTKMVLKVKDPASCDCCVTDIPICLPHCCSGEPEVCSRCGVFGRGIVDYYWCCGFHVRVVFTNCGDVIVHYYGR
jgi:hypothetical protein